MYKCSTYNSIAPKHTGDIKLSNNFDLIKDTIWQSVLNCTENVALHMYICVLPLMVAILGHMTSKLVIQTKDN